MNKQNLNRVGKKEREILKLVGSGVLFSITILAVTAIPGLPVVLAPFLKTTSERNSFKRSFKNLEQKNLIYLSGDKVRISKKGMEMLELLKADEVRILKTKWDGKWRVIAYDIPNKFKTKRDYFRRKLITLGFKNIQESIWAIPYECKEEISIFAQSLGLSPFILFMTTDYLPKQKELIKYFKL